MKQTNNAIKFLMAQYRSVFQHAFLKGLAATVVLTAGLSAFSAQAADTDAFVINTGEYTIEKSGGPDLYTYTLKKDNATFEGDSGNSVGKIIGNTDHTLHLQGKLILENATFSIPSDGEGDKFGARVSFDNVGTASGGFNPVSGGYFNDITLIGTNRFKDQLTVHSKTILRDGGLGSMDVYGCLTVSKAAQGSDLSGVDIFIKPSSDGYADLTIDPDITIGNLTFESGSSSTDIDLFVNVNSGDKATGYHSGTRTITVADNKKVTFADGTHNIKSSVSGSISVDSGTTVTTNPELVFAGKTSAQVVNDGTLNVKRPVTFSGGIVFNNNETVTVSSGSVDGRVGDKGNLIFNGSTLSNNAGATLTMGSGTTLTLDETSTFINKGKITLNSDAGAVIDVATLAVSQTVKDEADNTTFNIIDLKSALGDFNNSGTLTLKSANQSENVEYGLDTDINNLKELGVDFSSTDGTAKIIIDNVALRVNDNLNLSSASIKANISGSGSSYGEAELQSLKTLTYTTDASDAEDLNGLELVGIESLKFASGKSSENDGTSILVSGSKADSTQFGVNQSLTSDGKKDLKFQNVTLNLDNYTLDRDTLISGTVDVNLIMDSGSKLLIENNAWTAKNITLSGTGASSVEINHTTPDAYKTSLTAEAIKINSTNSTFKVTSNAELTANKGINVAAGSFEVSGGTVKAKSIAATSGTGTFTASGASVSVTGDGLSGKDKIDFAGGSNFNFTNSELALGDASDTINLTYDKTNGFNTEGYSQITATGTNITVDLSKVSGSADLTVEQANSLLGLLTNDSDNNFVHLNGATPKFDTTTNKDGEQEVTFGTLTSGGGDNLTLNFDTETTRDTVLTGVTGTVTGGWKAVQTETGNAEVGANGTLNLYATNSGVYAKDATGNIVGVTLGDASKLELNNKGSIGSITGANATFTTATGSDVTVVNTANNQILGDVTVGDLQGKGTLTANEIKTETATLTAGSVINAKTFTVSGDDANTQATGATISAESANFSGSTLLTGTKLTTTDDVKAENMNLTEGSVATVYGSLTATDLSLDGGSQANVTEDVEAQSITVVGDASLIADTVTLTQGSNGTLLVGQDSGQGSAKLVANKITLNGGTLIIDPDFTENTATAFAKTIGTLQSDEMVIDGNIIVGKNSALGLGGEESAFLENLARYQTNDKLNEDNYGSYVYINRAKIDLGGKQLIIGSENVETLKAMLGSGPDIYLGTASALQVSAQALNAAIDANSQVFTGLNQTNSIKVKGGTLIVPANMSSEQIQSIFGAQVKLTSGSGDTDLTVTTENGLFTGTIKAGSALNGTGFTMTLADNARSILSDLSNPTYDYVIAMFDESTNHYASEKDFQKAVSEAADGQNKTVTPAYDPDVISVVDNSFGYQFLQDALGSRNSRAVETSARLATFGGAVQALQVASNSTTDAVNSRLGMGNSASRLTVADNAQGAGLWVAPVYRNFSSDSFDGQGLGYGADVDLTGAALGADFTMSNGLRLGLAFNVGSGDADGQGAGAGVSNDFDYFGLALYAGFNPIQNLTLSADVSFTQVDNDLEAASGVLDYGKLTASTDSTAWSVGVGAQYLMQTASLDVAPHVGLRYTNFDVDDYDVKLNGNTLARTNGDSASVFSIPVGVSLSKDLSAGEWTVRPAADFTVTFNMGDDDIDSSTEFDGIYGANIKYNTEFMDNVTYGANFGVSAKNGNLSFGLNAGYTGSSNTDEYTVGANARFVF